MANCSGDGSIKHNAAINYVHIDIATEQYWWFVCLLNSNYLYGQLIPCYLFFSSYEMAKKIRLHNQFNLWKKCSVKLKATKIKFEYESLVTFKQKSN
jgi:hypothetical protein